LTSYRKGKKCQQKGKTDEIGRRGIAITNACTLKKIQIPSESSEGNPEENYLKPKWFPQRRVPSQGWLQNQIQIE
jgi:hypothetical protein